MMMVESLRAGLASVVAALHDLLSRPRLCATAYVLVPALFAVATFLLHVVQRPLQLSFQTTQA